MQRLCTYIYVYIHTLNLHIAYAQHHSTRTPSVYSMLSYYKMALQDLLQLWVLFGKLNVAMDMICHEHLQRQERLRRRYLAPSCLILPEVYSCERKKIKFIFSV
jgi:hypothetical protein